MATDAANRTSLDTAIAQTIARIVEVTASANPDYSVAGRSISKGAYLAQLNQALKELRETRQQFDGYFEVRTRGIARH
jgi:peptidoglycan hydrolase-like protein with peptidoglycan-binding domain